MKSVMRATLSVVCGYLAIALVLMAIFTGAYLLLGAEWSFKTDSWEASTSWNVMSLVVGLVAAFVGGLVTLRIDTTGKGVWVLMGLIVVLGVVEAVVAGSSAASETARTVVSPGNMEAMRNAVQPSWMYYLNPVIGCAGVFVSRHCCRR